MARRLRFPPPGHLRGPGDVDGRLPGEQPRKPNVDAVVVFTGEIGRIRSGARLTRETFARYLLVTRDQWRFVEGLIKRSGGLNGATLFVDETYATTTDGNARYAAPLLRDLGVQDVLLVSDWYHLPRSRFLLRSYLGGTKIKIHTYPPTDPGAAWSYPRCNGAFQRCGKRVGVACIGSHQDCPQFSGSQKQALERPVTIHGVGRDFPRLSGPASPGSSILSHPPEERPWPRQTSRKSSDPSWWSYSASVLIAVSST
jgi:hypothetical protein